MSIILRILLIAGALIALVFVANRIKKRKILMEDALSWLVVAGVLFIMAIVPQLVILLSEAIGFISPSNFVFLVIIALLLMKVFNCSSEISLLKNRVNELAQEIALKENQQQ